MAPRSRSFMLGHARRGTVVSSYYSSPPPFPQPGVASDLDFINRRYWWNGTTRTEADFTSLVLNGATWGPQGLDVSTCTSNPSITINLAALGLAMPPCVYALAGYFLSVPATNKWLIQFDDATAGERFSVLMTTASTLSTQVFDNSVSQASQNIGAVTPSATARFGIAFSGQLNEVLFATNGTGATPDTAATMPTVTLLRLAASTGANSFPPAIISRLWIFSAVKTQAEVNALSAQIRDAA